MDRLIRRSGRPWVLLFDTDCIAFRPGFLEALLAVATDAPAYMAGMRIYVDSGGFNVPPGTPEAIPYVHPHCALVHRESYVTLPPFEKHGAPCLANERAAGM